MRPRRQREEPCPSPTPVHPQTCPDQSDQSEPAAAAVPASREAAGGAVQSGSSLTGATIVPPLVISRCQARPDPYRGRPLAMAVAPDRRQSASRRMWGNSSFHRYPA